MLSIITITTLLFVLVIFLIFFLIDILFSYSNWKLDQNLKGLEKYSYITIQDLEKLLLLPNLRYSYQGIISKEYDSYRREIQDEPKIKITGATSSLKIEYIPKGEVYKINLFFKNFSLAYSARILVKIRQIQLKNNEQTEKFIPFDKIK